jgi:hypothetical protein
VGYLDQEPIGLGSRAVVRSVDSHETLRLGFWDFSEFCDDNAGFVQVDVLVSTA